MVVCEEDWAVVIRVEETVVMIVTIEVVATVVFGTGVLTVAVSVVTVEVIVTAVGTKVVSSILVLVVSCKLVLDI